MRLETQAQPARKGFPRAAARSGPRTGGVEPQSTQPRFFPGIALWLELSSLGNTLWEHKLGVQFGYTPERPQLPGAEVSWHGWGRANLQGHMLSWAAQTKQNKPLGKLGIKKKKIIGRSVWFQYKKTKSLGRGFEIKEDNYFLCWRWRGRRERVWRDAADPAASTYVLTLKLWS